LGEEQEEWERQTKKKQIFGVNALGGCIIKQVEVDTTASTCFFNC
jgi:hypothetical protein